MGTYPLRQLEAQFEKVVTVISTEIDDGVPYPDMKGLFVHRGSDGEKHKWGSQPESYEFHDVFTVPEADHIMFLCPLCFEKNKGSAGTHSIMVTFADRNVPVEAGSRSSDGTPTRWTVVSGTSLDDLVLSPSILLDASRKPEEGCHWHGFVGMSGIPPGHAG